MSLLFFDGFDGYDAVTDIVNHGKWDSTGVQQGISSVVRIGTGKSLTVGTNSGGTGGYAYYRLGVDKYNINLFIGFALNLVGSQNSGTLVAFMDVAAAEQISLHVTKLSATTYNLVAYRGATILATGTTTLSTGVFYWVEVKINIHNTAGIFDCRVNGTAEFTFSGNTRNSASLTMQYLKFSSTAPTNIAIGYYIDDLYICDSAGTLNNTYLGEVQCLQLPLIGDTTAGFTRNTGASNYLAVDDPLGAPDDTTTYVSSSVVTTRDEYTLTNTTGTNAIFGVKINTRAQKDSANPKSFKHGIKTGANQQEATVFLGIGYANYENLYESSDGAGTAWTPTALDNAVSFIEVL